jgi:hypothetical protein
MEEFHNAIQSDAHSGFQRWRRAYPNGYFLTEKTKRRYNLHQTKCPHVGNSTWQRKEYNQSLATHRKICSGDVKELLGWAKENDIAVKICKDCRRSHESLSAL